VAQGRRGSAYGIEGEEVVRTVVRNLQDLRAQVHLAPPVRLRQLRLGLLVEITREQEPGFATPARPPTGPLDVRGSGVDPIQEGEHPIPHRLRGGAVVLGQVRVKEQVTEPA
jgi:hypothetical protein